MDRKKIVALAKEIKARADNFSVDSGDHVSTHDLFLIGALAMEIEEEATPKSFNWNAVG